MNTELRSKILERVRKHDHVSFAEIRTHFGGDGSLDGEFCLYLGDRPNTMLWVNMSEDFVSVMMDLLAKKEVHVVPSSLLVYMIDGAVPSMPMAKRPGKHDYPSPRWFCVVLRPGPLPQKKSPPACRARLKKTSKGGDGT